MTYVHMVHVLQGSTPAIYTLGYWWKDMDSQCIIYCGHIFLCTISSNTTYIHILLYAFILVRFIIQGVCSLKGLDGV